MSEQPVNVDAADVDIEKWNRTHSPLVVNVVDGNPNYSDVKDYNEEPDL